MFLKQVQCIANFVMLMVRFQLIIKLLNIHKHRVSIVDNLLTNLVRVSWETNLIQTQTHNLNTSNTWKGVLIKDNVN